MLGKTMTEKAMNENAVVSKVIRRIIPYIFVCYIANYLDRFNVSFAALEMKGDLGFSDTVYGLGAGMWRFRPMAAHWDWRWLPRFLSLGLLP